MIINISDNYSYRFPFKIFCKHIVDILPEADIVGIREIRLVNDFSHPESDSDSLASYLGYGNGTEAIIEVHLINLIKHKIPDYLLRSLFEITGLFLSEILSHEVGHHVFQYKRNNITNISEEEFANKYAMSGYYQYLDSRKRKILFEYNLASWNYLTFDRASRKKFSQARTDLIYWLDKHKDGIPYP